MMLRLLILFLCLPLIVLLAAEDKCSTDQFTCANGSCIKMKWRCDGSPDCPDDSDELGCPKTTCADEFFRCDDGKCVPQRWVCDNEFDCDDESDEKKCDNKTCDGYHCEGNNHCIPLSWQCDGKADCNKGDDEQGCANICTENEFACDDDKCIDIRWHCDGHEDCKNGTDELNCGACDEGEFVCTNGQCINDQWFCDGDNDCKDGSDEENCTMKELMNKTCESNMFQCATPLNEAKCIAISWRCDGDPDCPDGSDEHDKECGDVTCASDERMCSESKYCVKKSFFCDGETDCLDGSDELNCNNTEIHSNCEPNQFDCNGDGSKCIFDIFKCDGNDDCGNYQDEQDCPMSNVCKTNNGGCQHICVPMTSSAGRVCECDTGFELAEGSETSCVDINECEIRGTCSQICINTKGSYKCECEENYILTNHRYCKADSHHPELILSDDEDIRRYELANYHYTLLLGDQKVSGAVAMDFDIRNEMVYWAGAHHEGVMSANLRTHEVTPLLPEVETPDGLAVDWVHGNLYISDTGHNHIVVSRLDGTNTKVIVSGDMDEPRAIVVDPYHGWMYWTDWGSAPKIEKCGMNGKERSVIVTNDIVWPNGLAIDYVDNRLYWVDAKLHHIASTDLDGNDFRLVLKGLRRLGHPFGITVFEDYVYWTDWIDNAVHKMSKFGTGNTSTIALNLKYPYDVSVYHIYRQPSKVNYCGSDYGGCSHLCLPSPQHVTGSHIVKKYECACPTGMVLDDGKNCVGSTDATTPKPVKPTKPTDEGNPNRPQTPKTKPSTEKPTTQKPTEKPVITKEPKAEQTTEKSGAEVTIKYIEGTTEDSTHSKGGNNTELSGKKDNEKETGHVAIIAVAVVAVIFIIIVLAVFVVRRFKKKNVKSMNFDNPVYRKTTTDDQLIMDKDAPNSRLERESMQPLNQEPEIV